MADKGEKLSNCPFCGGEARLHGSSGGSWAECTQCHVETPGAETTKAEAAALWNRRPSTGAGESDWVVVPREATPEMLEAWYRYKSGLPRAGRDTSDRGAYRAMLASAPAPASESDALLLAEIERLDRAASPRAEE